MTDINRKALYIAQECLKAGMTVAGAAGVLANVAAESAFNPRNLQDTYERALGYNDDSYTDAVDNGTYQNFTRDGAGYGLPQWTSGERKAKMLTHFKQRGKSIGDFETQVEYMILDIRTYGSGKAWKTCISSNNPYDCGYAVCKYYEICDKLEESSQYRGNQAQTKWLGFIQASLDSGLTVEPPKEPEPAKVDEEGIPIPQTWPPRTIDAHCSGWPEVWLLQALLKCMRYNVLVDGIWGTSLTDKVILFQQANGLSADGVVGPMTWQRLGLSAELFKK